LGALALILVLGLRPSGWLAERIFNASHVLFSAGIGWGMYRLSGRLAPAMSEWVHCGMALLIVALLGGGLEIAQLVAPGEASMHDFVNDMLGALSGVSLGLSTASRFAQRFLVKLSLRGTAVLPLLAGLAPTCVAVLADIRRASAFPVLAGFEHQWEQSFVRAGAGARVVRGPAPSSFTRSRGQYAAKVTFAGNHYPKLEMARLGDWSDYDSLVFEVYVPEARSTKISLRVHDHEHDRSSDDRFNTVLTLPPGQSTISVSVEDIARGPAWRKLDVSRLKGIILFVARPSTPVTLYFDEFRLTRDHEPE
jgi:hypothetical protein